MELIRKLTNIFILETRSRFIDGNTDNISGLSQKVVDVCYNTRICIRNSMKLV